MSSPYSWIGRRQCYLLYPPALSAENQKGVEDEEDAGDDVEAGHGKAGGARVGGGGEEGLVEVDLWCFIA